MVRAQERVEDFITAATDRQADMIVQLGDFNHADMINAPCTQAWNSLAEDHLQIWGRTSTFVSPTPEERGFPRWAEVTAAQEDRRLGLG